MMITQQDVWAAAAMAYRVNNHKYVRESYTFSSESDPELNQQVVANKLIVVNSLTDREATPQPTSSDQELGDQARRAISRNITMKMLSDQALSSFDETVRRALNIESWSQIDRYNWAIIASQISAYYRLLEHHEIALMLKNGYLGSAGEKVTTEVQVITCSYSQVWDTFYVRAKTTNNQLVMFTYRERLERGAEITVTGRIKSCRRDTSLEADLTQLSRVKITQENA